MSFLGLLVVSAVEPHQMQRCAIDDLSLFASFDAYDVRGYEPDGREPDRDFAHPVLEPLAEAVPEFLCSALDGCG